MVPARSTLLSRKLARICRAHRCSLAFLFGSQARIGHSLLTGRRSPARAAGPDSDLDVGVVLGDWPLVDLDAKLVRHASLFAEADSLFNARLRKLGRSPIELDLVFLQETDWLVQVEALKGLCVFKGSEMALADYREKVWKFAADWKWVMDAYNADRLESMRAGAR